MICTLSSCTARAAQLARSMRARGGIVAATAARSMSGLITGHPQCNIPPAVAEKVGWNLHLRPAHPLGIIKGEIEARLQKDAAARGERAYKVFDQLSPVVTTQQNFDSLLIPADHVSRSPSDTYYLDAARVLRCHTSAHQVDLLRAGHDAFLATGDVYRRDDVDASHYFAFHQMEGVRVFEPRADAKAHAEQHLKASLEGVVDTLFGPVQKRWVPAYFPFTEPSFELEIHFQGDWLEVLGCGVIHDGVLRNAGITDRSGWAFGLGLERLAMVLFSIPDIRLFWSSDSRFHDQFKPGQISTFVPYSKYPPCTKDMTFWLPPSFHANDLSELARTVAGDLVERVQEIDRFVHPKTGRESRCYRVTYRSMDRSLTNAEVDEMQFTLRELVTNQLGAELR